MPPRYAYWTIIVDEQPTAFRAAAQDDLMPTFKRLKEKHPTATMMWFQNGKLWPSRVDAQEAMRARGEMGRRGDSRQRRLSSEGHGAKVGGFRARPDRPPRERSDRSERPEWKPKHEDGPPAKLEWKPKGEFAPAPKRERFAAEGRVAKPENGRTSKPEWKPKGSFGRDRKPEWKPKSSFGRDRKPDWKPKAGSDRPPAKLEWKPRGDTGAGPKPHAPGPKRKWIPKQEYKRAQGIEVPRDNKWRPGGEHRDPKQKYKDAKKAKWGRFKQTVRKRWESKQEKPPGKKKRGNEE